jgi:phosphatidylglycerophosphatase C
LAPNALAYLFHRDRGRIKAAATREFLRGVARDRIEADAREFAERFSRSLLRPDAVAAWKRWRGERVRLVIVTASPDLIVAPFARGLGADALIGTELDFDAENRVTGDFATPNCRGPEKVVRLKAAFGPDLELKAAYGDTGGDREMLAMAEIAGYRVFEGRP